LISFKSFFRWGVLLLQFCTAVSALRCLKKNVSIEWKILIAVWVLTFLVEAAGKILGFFLKINNHILYNIYFIIFFNGLIYFYYRTLHAKAWKKISLVLLISYNVITVYLFFKIGIKSLYSYSFSAGGSIVIILGIAYFIKLYKDEVAFISLRGDPVYWISLGLILYFAGQVPMIGMYNLLVKKSMSFINQYIFYFGNFITVVLHFFLIKGFTVKRNE